MSEPVWVEKAALLSLHSRSLALHGGAEGVRDEGLLDSALNRALNRHHYEDVADIVELAATYGVAVARNHPFVDGNKRAAFQCVTLFLRLNGLRLFADRVDATRATVAVAAGVLDQVGFADWIRSNCKPWPKPSPPAPGAV